MGIERVCNFSQMLQLKAMENKILTMFVGVPRIEKATKCGVICVEGQTRNLKNSFRLIDSKIHKNTKKEELALNVEKVLRLIKEKLLLRKRFKENTMKSINRL